MKNIIAAVCVAVVLGACASKEAKEVKKAEGMPVNCGRAEADIRLLRTEKTTVAEQIAQGVTAVYPIGFLIGVATQTEGEKFKIASGDYNQILDKKIAEIQQKCGVK